MKRKVLFITPNEIYDEYGIGGVKVTRKNYKLVEGYFGTESTYLCTFPKKEHTQPPQNAVTFKRTQNSKLLVAGNGGSSSDADHIVGELMKGFVLPRKLEKGFAERLRTVDNEKGAELASRHSLQLH